MRLKLGFIITVALIFLLSIGMAAAEDNETADDQLSSTSENIDFNQNDDNDDIVDLEVTGRFNKHAVFQEGVVELSISVRNYNDNAENVKVNVNLPNGLEYIFYKANQGTFNPKNSIWDIGNLTSSDSAHLTIALKAIEVGETTTEIWATTDSNDIDMSNNYYKDFLIIEKYKDNVDLEVNANFNRYSVFQQAEVRLSISVWNLRGNAENVKVHVKLSSGLKYIFDYATKGTFNPKNSIWDIGNLTSYESADLTIALKAIEVGETTAEICATTDSNDNDMSNNQFKANITIEKNMNPHVITDPQSRQRSMHRTHYSSEGTGFVERSEEPNAKPVKPIVKSTTKSINNPIIITFLLTLTAIGIIAIKKYKK